MITGSTGQHAGGGSLFDGDTETWNVADGFTKINVLKILIEVCLYELIACFGRQNEKEYLSKNEIVENRIFGFERMKFSIRQVITNTMFKIDRKDMDIVNDLLSTIEVIDEVSDKIYYSTYNHITKEEEVIINEKHFKKCLKSLGNIKETLFFILNHAGLIFRKGEEIDLDEFARSVYEG